MKAITYIRLVNRACLTLSAGCLLLPSPLCAEVEIADNHTHYLYSAYNNPASFPKIGHSDAQLLQEAYNTLAKKVAEDPRINQCLNDVLPGGGSGVSIRDIYNDKASVPHLDVEAKPGSASTPLRGEAFINGKDVKLYAWGIVDAVHKRWSNLNGTPRYGEEDMLKAQIRATMFHESGHQLLINKYSGTAFQNPNISKHANEIIILHEAFAVYCNYLCCKYIDNEPNFNLLGFVRDALLFKNAAYGIGIDYMWRYIVCLDFNAPGFNDGKPRKELYEAYLKPKSGVSATWRSEQQIQKTWDAQGDKEAQQRQRITNALITLFRSQSHTLQTPQPPPIEPQE